MRRGLLAATAGALALAAAPPANADIANFDLAARIYTKWLYRNNDSQGLLNLGTPHPDGDDYSGDNGVGTEFELKFFGRVSKYVQGYARIQSRFGELWQDWWESGNRWYDGETNTSGESGGMNHASYIKLRGTFVRAAIPIPTLDWVTIGSSDLGMFNPWSIGRVRYIDRDNAKGIFLDGHVGDGIFSYNLAVIALPKLYVGPYWSTGLTDPNLPNPFWSSDWAYGAKFTVAPSFGTFTLVSTLTNDVEIDRSDPDAVGSLYPDCTDDLGNPIVGCEKDHAVDYFSRYMNSVTTLEAQVEPLSWMSVNAFGGFSAGLIDRKLAANGVERMAGVSPVVYKDTYDFAVRARVELSDPFDVGLSIKAEYFNIGAEWNSIFGARRESDVLLTDGFLEGGQLPTLNLANEFVDFDEPWYESCIGWHGGTLVAQYAIGGFDVSAEGTYMTYNTNAQDRDVETTYPNFLHEDGFTDTDLYDYANTTDRGRDPRSVYHLNQDRRTAIAVLNARYVFDVLGGLELSTKAKFIHDLDYRSHTTASDDYTGDLLTWRGKVGLGVAPGLLVEAGAQIDRWWEKRRDGTLKTGYGDIDTAKHRSFAGLTYEFEGLKFRYALEFLDKDQLREPRKPDQHWLVFRSKASLEVNW